jgi:putative transposase
MLGKGDLPMPWNETCVMDERVLFIAGYLRGEQPMSVLCEQFGISRKTGYKWLERYRADPEGGLADRSRVPRHCPWAIAAESAAMIVALRQRRPYWGPRKLRAALERDHPDLAWPAASTMGDLLRRGGLSEPRGGGALLFPRAHPSALLRQPTMSGVPTSRAGSAPPMACAAIP